MTEFISHRKRVDCEEYALSYERLDLPGAGYSFPCDHAGNLKEGLTPAALENLRQCQEGTAVKFVGIATYQWHYYEPAVIKCEQCSAPVSLDDAVTNACPRCETLYNGFGQRLAPRDQWEEDY